MSSQLHPLTAPYVAPGCWPGATDADKAFGRQLIKQEIVLATAFDACPTKAIISGGAGFGLGAFFSLMSQSFRYEDPLTSPAFSSSNLRAHQKAAEIFKDMGRGMWRGGKQWGLLGMLFSGIECCVEGVRDSCGSIVAGVKRHGQYRGKHDVYNVFTGGFITGCLISGKNGVKSGILSGLGFGCFGAAIDKVWVEREVADPPVGFPCASCRFHLIPLQ